MRVITPFENIDDFSDNGQGVTPCVHRGEVIGRFLCAPRRAVTDVYARSMRALELGRVLVLYIDGLGYALYHRVARAHMPFSERLFDCEPAYTAYPPLTQPCMASMLTGVWPDVHGIHSRREHRPLVPSLLAVPGAVLVEADCAPLALEREPVLTLPEPGEDVDGAVLRAALPIVRGDAPLVIVHFHGLDDLEHEVGDDETRLAPKLRALDGAVRQLTEGFHGTAILCADHGAHRENGVGSHGCFDYRDMFVPYGEAIL